jgi:hypothetical protein
MTNDNVDTRSPVNLARKVMSGAVTELMSAGVHPTDIMEAMTQEMEVLVKQITEVDRPGS